MKNTVLFALVIFALGAGAIAFIGSSSDDSSSSVDSVVSTTDTTDENAEAQQSAAAAQQAVENPDTTNNQELPACVGAVTCDAEEVARHNSPADCWVIFEDKIYDVSSYVNTHEGGAESFDSSTCGTDIAAQLTGQAGSDSSPKRNEHGSSAYTQLANFYVTDLITN